MKDKVKSIGSLDQQPKSDIPDLKVMLLLKISKSFGVLILVDLREV